MIILFYLQHQDLIFSFSQLPVQQAPSLHHACPDSRQRHLISHTLAQSPWRVDVRKWSAWASGSGLNILRTVRSSAGEQQSMPSTILEAFDAPVVSSQGQDPCGYTLHIEKTIRDHHNGEAEDSCQRPALSALKRDPRSIFTPPYPCFSLFYSFFCLFVTISLMLRSVSCFLRASRVSRLLRLCPCCLRLNGLLVTLFVFISE